MTKIDIVSGFLGAGKTTLIKKLLAEAYRALPPLGREAVRSLIDSLGALCRAQEKSVP